MVDPTKIILKTSDVPAKAPTTNDIDLGEIAINTYDGDLFLKRDQDGEITIIRFTRDNPIENVIFVQKSGSDSNRGDSWDSAYLTIERAIEDAWTRDGAVVLIEVGPGVYTTKGHIDMPDNSILKCVYRSVKIRPEPGYEERNVFRMGSGCFIEGPVFEGFRVDSFVDPSEGFAAVFRPGAIITRTPYVHKIAVRSIPTWTQIAPPLDRANSNPLVPRGGGVVMADGNVISPYSIYPNLMTWGATPVIHNGVGYVAKNGALINAVNAISMWAHKHFYAINGGQIVLSGCSTQFGDYTLIAEGVRNVVNPYSLDYDLVANTTAGEAIYSSSNTIISGMWANLVSEGYTTDWPQIYEDRTMTDANLLMRSLSWTVQSGNEKPVRDFAKGFFDAQGDRVFTPQEYDYDKCFRDTGLISEAVAYDIAFGSNYRSVNAAKSYHRANASEVVTTQLADTVAALTHQKAVVGGYLSGNTLFRSDSLFDEVIDIVSNGEASANSYIIPDPVSIDPGFSNARDLLMQNKEFIQQEIDAWIKYQIDNDIAPFNRVAEHRYDQATCSRDVGLIIDSLGYDMMFGSNIRAITAGRSYYRQGAAVVTQRQKVATVSAFQYLKTKLSEIVSSVPAAVSRIEAGMDIIINILESGLASTPAFVAPVPSSGNTNSFDTGYLNARNNVELNRAFIKAETAAYLEIKYPAIEYDKVKCLRDVDYILDALFFDTTYGGNLETIIAGNAYFSGSVLQFAERERAPTIDVYEYLGDLLAKIATSTIAVPYQDVTLQVSGTAGSQQAGIFVKSLIDTIVETVRTGQSQPVVQPDTSWVASNLTSMFSTLQSSKVDVQSKIIAYVDSFFDVFTYNRELCKRDVGLIIDAIGYDMMFDSNFRSVTAGRSYYRSGASDVIGLQKVVTLSALEYLRGLVVDIVDGISATAATRVASNINTVIDILTNGLSVVPAIINQYTITLPTGGTGNAFTASYKTARDEIESYRAFLKSSVVSFIATNYPTVAATYNQVACERDIDYILNATYYDMTYGGNLETVIAARSYYSNAVLQLGAGETEATIAAYNHLKSQMVLLATNAVDSAMGTIVGNLFQTVIDAIQTGSVEESSVVLPDTTWVASGLTSSHTALQASKTTTATAIIDYIDTGFVRSYDAAACSRDVGLIVDAVAYDLALGSNFRSVTAGRSYYRNGAAAVTTSQKAITLAAIEYLKNLMVASVSSSGNSAISSVNSLTNTVINIITNGLAAVPSTIGGFIITTPTGGLNNAYTPAYATVRNSIESNRSNLKTGVTTYISTNFPAIANTYNQTACERDVDYILNAVYYDMTYGGNLESVVAAKAYYSNAVLQLGSGETPATVATYGYLRDQIGSIALGVSNTALSDRAESLVQVVIDTIQTGNTSIIANTPDMSWVSANSISAFDSLQSDKEDMKVSVIDYVDSRFSRMYDVDLCKRDVGLIVDAIGYDFMFGSNFRTVTAARSYYRAGASAVTERQKVMTVSAIDHLKGYLYDVVSGTSLLAGQRINENMDLLINTIQNGVGNLPANISQYAIPTPTGGINNAYTTGYANARNAIEANRSTLKASTISFIESNFPSIANTYNQAACERDIDYILNATYYDMTYGGNLESVVAAKSYYSNAVLQLGAGETAAATAAYGYMRDQIGTIATNAANTFIGDSAKSLIQVIIDVVDTGNTNITATEPNVAWVLGSLIDSYNTVQFYKELAKISVIDFVDSEFIYGYDVAKCRRDVGLIVDALRYDLTYGGNLETYNAAASYFVGTQTQFGSGENQATVASLNRMSDVLGYVLQAEALPDITPGNLMDQSTLPPAGSLVAATFAQTRIGEIASTITSNGNLPIRILPSILWAEPEYQNAFTLINIHKSDITVEVMEYISKQTKSLLGAFLNAYDYINTAISNLPGIAAGDASTVTNIINNIKTTIINPLKVEEPSLISAIGHTWTAIMSGVALTKIPSALNQATIQDSILELNKGSVIASGQDDQGSALFVGGLEINADTGELAGPPFQQAVNRISTRAAISRSF